MSQRHLALDAPPVTGPAAAVSIVSATGDLDEAAAVRLLRWCEMRLHLLDIGQTISHLLLDLSHARRHRRSPSWITSVPKRLGAGSRLTSWAPGR